MLKQLLKNRYEFVTLVVVFLIAIGFRWYSFHNNGVTFWFDQSRDAYISRQIIEDRDFKLLGPSASGTKDTVYHGVLYYYLIAPAYWLGEGDPMVATTLLYVIASLAIFPLYYLFKDVFVSKKVGIVAVILYAFSVEATQLSGWLSNPTMAILPIATYYLALWKAFYKGKSNWMILAGISFGLLFQSVLWLVYTAGSALVAIYYSWIVNKGNIKKVLPLKTTVLAIGAALIIISPWIIGQVKLAMDGIFSLSTFAEASNREQVIDSDVVFTLLNIFLTKNLFTLLPSWTIGSLFLFALILLRLQTYKPSRQWFLISWLLSSLWLITWHARLNLHIFIGMEMVVLAIFAEYIVNGLSNISSNWLRRIAFLGVLSLYLLSNIKVASYFRSVGGTTFAQQPGAVLHTQLTLIDKTYEIANGQPFTISTFTNPIGYNITWAYLYDWHGQNKYGYKPGFFGPNQAGLFGSDLMGQSKQPQPLHFSIIEPVATLSVHQDAFEAEQNRLGELVEEIEFGSMVLQVRTTLSDQL